MLPSLQAIDENYTGVHYAYGHPADIVEELIQKSKTEKHRYSKYPFIGLFLDIPESKGRNIEFATSARLNMFICCGTTKTFKPYQRTQLTFVPILIPIYEEFINQLLKHKAVVKPENMLIPHQYAMRYQWGKGGLEYYNNGQKNIFNDAIDAIELIGLELDFKQNC